MASGNLENPSSMTMIRSSFQFGFNYLQSKYLPAGQCISSPSFAAGGYDWSVEFYPQGQGDDPEKQASHVALYLNLESQVKEIRVDYSFQLLNKTGKFVTIGNPEIVNFTEPPSGWGAEEFLARDTVEKLYCVNGFLVISCSIRILHVDSSPLIVETCHSGLCEHIEKLWEKGEKCDVTFEVEGQKISAHRLMLAARSPVFEAELFGPMAEAKMKLIKINEMKADVFKALLHFIYTDRLAKDGSNEHEPLSVEFLQGLFVAADRYGIDKLTLLCEEQLGMNLSVDTVVTTLLFSDHYNRAGLKIKCLNFASCPENFMLVATTKNYLNGMLSAPSLFAELSDMVKCALRLARKQRTG